MRRLLSIIALAFSVSAHGQAANPVVVKIEAMDAIAFHPEVTQSAHTVALHDSRIAAQVDAAVLAVHVKVGEQVQQGQSLVTLDDRDRRIALEEAEASLRNRIARLELAQYRLAKVDALLKSNSISADDAKQRETDVASLESERAAQATAVAKAKLELARCNVQAPFAGVVTERLIAVGEWVAPGTPLLRLVSDRELELSARIQLSDVEALMSAVDLRFESGDIAHPVTLRALTEAVGETDRMREARLVFTSSKPLAGQSGTLRFAVATSHLPASVLVRRGDQTGYFEAVANEARFRPVPGIREGQPAPVSVTSGRYVVAEGRHRLQDGDALAPID